MKDSAIEPLIGIYAVSKQRGLIPTWAFSDKAGCYVAIKPFRWCQLDSVSQLTESLTDYLLTPVKEVDLSFEEAAKKQEVQDYLGAKNTKDLEQKTVSVSISVEPNKFDIHALGRSARGGWDNNEPYALKLDIPKEQGLKLVAKAIVDHIQSRDDLPDERVISVPPSIANEA